MEIRLNEAKVLKTQEKSTSRIDGGFELAYQWWLTIRFPNFVNRQVWRLANDSLSVETGHFS
jgi:hypothetical protein